LALREIVEVEAIITVVEVIITIEVMEAAKTKITMEVIAKITAAEATIIKAATIMAADSMEDSPEMETTSEAGEVVDGEEEAANAWKPVKVAVGAAVTIKTRISKDHSNFCSLPTMNQLHKMKKR
jgi:uncharacterized membrane protein YbjE (DUF340 family)